MLYPQPPAGEYDNESQRRDAAKHSLERYMHYFERFDAHNKARVKVGARQREVQGWAEVPEQRY